MVEGARARTLTFRHAIGRARRLDDLNELFRAETRFFGFTGYAAGFLPEADAEEGTGTSRPFLLMDWPRAWLEMYASRGFAQEDEGIAEATRTDIPFTWTELRSRYAGASARILAAAAAFGWNDGLIVPVPNRTARPGERFGIVSLAAPSLDQLGDEARAAIVEISLAAFRRALSLDRAPGGQDLAALTERERESLRLVATGQGDAAIGSALGISQATAHYHVESAKRRLGATTRAQAVALALAGGLLAE